MARNAAARCLSLPPHIVVVPAATSVRPFVLPERNSPVLSTQSAPPPTTFELPNTVDRVQIVAKDDFSMVLKKGWLVELPLLQFLSAMQGMTQCSTSIYTRLTWSPSIRRDVLIATAVWWSANRPEPRGTARPILWEHYRCPNFGSFLVPRTQRKSRIMHCPGSGV